MLPDLSSVKEEVQEKLSRYIRITSHKKCGAFSLSPVHLVHEGHQMKTIRADGSIDCVELQHASASTTIPMDKSGRITAEERMRMLDRVSDEMAAQMMRHFYGTIDSVLESKGQTIDASGLSPVEAVFAAIDRVQIDFDEEGKMKDFVISGGAQVVEMLKKVEVEIRGDPALQRRWDQMMERKLGESRAREASRKLVG